MTQDVRPDGTSVLVRPPVTATMRHILAVLFVLSAIGCDSSESNETEFTRLAGTYTLTADGVGQVQGTAHGARFPPSGRALHLGSVRGGTFVDVPEGPAFSISVETIGLTPGRYRVARTEVADPVEGCGGAAQSSETGNAFVTVYIDSDGRSCAATVVGGEVVVVSSAESDVRMRYSFVAVPAVASSLPDTVRASGTFALAAAGR